MIEGYFEITLNFIRGDDHGQPFDEFLDRVLDELEAIDREADYTANARELTATFSIPMVSGQHPEVLGDLRTALHAASCATAGWGGMTSQLVTAQSQPESELLPF